MPGVCLSRGLFLRGDLNASPRVHEEADDDDGAGARIPRGWRMRERACVRRPSRERKKKRPTRAACPKLGRRLTAVRLSEPRDARRGAPVNGVVGYSEAKFSKNLLQRSRFPAATSCI